MSTDGFARPALGVPSAPAGGVVPGAPAIRRPLGGR